MKALVCLAVLLLIIQPLRAQKPSQFCRGVLDDGVLLEVTVTGRGMIWPNLVSQVFFRLRKDGVVFYDARVKTGMVRRSFKLNEEELASITSLLSKKDLTEANGEYPILESMRDAVLKTCVDYKDDVQKKILLINYRPTHAKAAEYYPGSLRDLLTRISKLRPSTSYERKYGGAEAGLP